MQSFTQAELNTVIAVRTSGSFTAANFLTIANDSVRDILNDVDLRGSKRNTALSPNLFSDTFQYTCPADLKENKIIDIPSQIDRGRLDYWRLVTQEEFDRYKEDHRIDLYGDPIRISRYQNWQGDNLVAISDDDLVRKLLLSRPVDDTSVTIDSLSAVGDWEAFGDGTNLTADSSNYVQGSASINWDINADGGTTAGIQNTSLGTFDITAYASLGYAFVWSYITSATDLTNYKLLIGQDLSSNYFTITITTNNEGVAFYAGWNLLRFDFVNKSETGTVDLDGCDSVALYMTKDAGKTSETDYRFDNLVLKIGKHYNVVYYSSYLWQSNAGVFLEDATTTTDLLNVSTVEYGLVIEKTLENMEMHLKNPKKSAIHEKKYEKKLARYSMDNPSEALTLVQTYYDL